MAINLNDAKLIELLADNEHKRWAKWQKYLHSVCIKNDNGSITIPKELVEHWEYDIKTDYMDLPENIKDSDRKEVYTTLGIIGHFNQVEINRMKQQQYNEDLKNAKIEGLNVKKIDGLNFEQALSYIINKYLIDTTLDRQDFEIAKLVTRFLNTLLTYKHSAIKENTGEF